MNKEFHYYMTYYLARKAGLPEKDCYVLAYSSQMTDDNNSVYTIRGKSKVYENYISQTLNILKPENKLMRIYLCFHFIPGDYESPTAYRKDGKMHLLNTTPDSKIARKLVVEALQSKNIYRIGIAIHAYADTWAHQNFIGCNDYLNSNKKIPGLLIPNIGHADFLHKPDIVGLKWNDRRLAHSHQIINNQERILEAAHHIYLILKAYNGGNDIGSIQKIINKKNDAGWMSIKEDLSRITGPVFSFKENTLDRAKKRMAGYKELLQNNYIEYNQEQWFKDAVNTQVRGFRDKPMKLGKSSFIPDIHTMKDNFEDSHWFKFQEAVIAHQGDAKELIQPRTDEKMELEDF